MKKFFLGSGVPLLLALAVLMAGPPPASAQSGTLEGRVVDRAGVSVPDAQVRLVDLAQSAMTDSEGTFRFTNVPAGAYILEVTSPRSGRAVSRVSVEGGVTSRLTLRLDPFYEGDEIVVTARPSAALQSEAFQATEVLSGARLRTLRQPTLGGTLSNEPGVSSSYFGPGAGRPIIRGFAGDRIAILENGLTVADASSTSPDHAVSIDPAAATRIEIVRGPATLLYGSSAVGGVVNVEDGRIPRERPDRLIQGAVEGWGASVSDEWAGRFDLTGRAGSLVWHASGLHRDADDLRIPREPGHGHGQDHAAEGESERRLENSSLETTRGAVGLGYVGERGYIGVSWTGFQSEYGVPGHGHDDRDDDDSPDHDHGHGHDVGHDDGVFVDMTQRRVDLDGALRFAGGVLRELRGRFQFSNYDHAEIEDGITATRVANDQWNVRLEARNRTVGPFAGAVGVQFGDREFDATGEEAFVPPSDAFDFGGFIFQEAEWREVTLQFGSRYERRRARNLEEGVQRTTSGFSTSAGINWRASDDVTLALSGSRSVKLPSVEELYSNGPHLATRSFELGNRNLDRERALTLDAMARFNRGPVSFQLTGFVNWFDDFIFQELTGVEMEGLPVLRYVQADAVVTGFEAGAEVDLIHTSTRHLTLVGGTDFVRAQLRDNSVPLPRIPPFRVSGGVKFAQELFSGGLMVRHTARQSRTAPGEGETQGFTMLDANLGYRVARSGNVGHEILLVGANLTDEFGRSHVSFLRDEAPLPGRDVRLIYRLTF